MKFAAAFLGLLCLSVAYGFSVKSLKHTKDDEHTLSDDLFELANLLPKDEIVEWGVDKMYNDEDCQKFLEYLSSHHFAKVDEWAQESEEVYELLNYLEDEGVDAYQILNLVRKFVGLPEIQPRNLIVHIKPHSEKSSRDNIVKMLKGLMALAPPEIEWELSHLLEELGEILKPHSNAILNKLLEKLNSDVHIQNLYDYITSEKTEAIYHHMEESKEFQELLELLRRGNLDVDRAIQLGCDFLGWTCS